MSPVALEILRHAQSLPEGAIMTTTSLSTFGNQASVTKALSVLAADGSLLRIFRGAYVAPAVSRFGTRAPSPHALIPHLALHLGSPIASHGAAAANALHLSTQVPAREVYVTTGPSRRISLGRRALLLEQVPEWQLLLHDRPAGFAIRALSWLGPDRAPDHMAALRRTLRGPDWQELLDVRADLPAWLSDALEQTLTSGAL